MHADELMEELGSAREELLRQSEGLPDSILRQRPATDEWSMIEVLAHHIDDVDYHYLNETFAIRDNPEHTFKVFDDERWKADHTELPRMPVQQIMDDLKESHRTVLGAVALMTSDELERAGIHPRRGAYTVRDVLLRFPAHDRNHAKQIESIRNRLGLHR